MANASGKKIGPGAQGKQSGTGAMTDLQEDLVGENDVLDNREKAGRGQIRGMDGKSDQTDQYQDHNANRRSKQD